jgi:hypothetical protein
MSSAPATAQLHRISAHDLANQLATEGVTLRFAQDGVERIAQIAQHVNVLYRWEWRQTDATYERFDRDQSVVIEACFRQGHSLVRIVGNQFPGCQGKERKVAVDFVDMTVFMAGDAWCTAIRRWDRDVPMGESWDHQVDNVSIVDVETQSRDYKVVETAFFGRERKDKKEPRISQRTHRITRGRRVQNCGLLALFQAQRKVMEEKRGKDKVELTRTYAWHGSGKTCPDDIASGAGIMMQYGNSQGFYQQGSYSAEEASYSHHERYVYRSNDVEGRQASGTGKYFHLLLVNVLRGNPLKTSDVWKGQGFGPVQEKLGQEFDSVEGGPHQPSKAGPGTDDSIIYVVYHASQCLPEFIVTYTEDEL